MEIISKLGIGPMSSEVIEGAFRCSKEQGQTLMLIASPNQIHRNGGYVNGWTTKNYTDYIDKMSKKYSGAQILLCRDHCGPGFGDKDIDEVYRTIDDDIDNGFNLIHVDFCHYSNNDKEKLTASFKAIEYILNRNPDLGIEIGTDENNGWNFRELTDVEKQMQYFTSFCRPLFYVGQTGSLVGELGQQGTFNEVYVRGLHDLAGKYNLALKEHNADYLGRDEIRRRRGLVDAVNIAPQYGVLQTQLTLQKCLLYGIDYGAFLEEAYNSRRWVKWLCNNGPENKMLCAIVAGHYNFFRDSYKRIYGEIEKHEDFKETIISEMMKNFKMYLDNLK